MRWLWLPLTLLGIPLAAQTAAPLARAAATITETDVMHRVSAIAADSMLGRATPSPGLERAAEYVASEFQRAGLRPAGDKGSYLQRFAVTRWTIDTSRSVVELAAGGRRGAARLGRDARYVLGTIPSRPVQGSVFLLTALDAATASIAADVKNRIVLLALDFSKPLSPALNQKIVDLARAGPQAVLVLSNRDSVTFAERLAAAARPRLTRDQDSLSDQGAPVIEVHERGLARVLAAAGIDPSRLRLLRQEHQRLLPALTITLKLVRHSMEQARVPNVAGILEGSDPLLRNQYLLYSAHMDHIGVSPGQPDSINNGADDNASGVAGLLELVEAFGQPGAQPKRSLLFLAPSGEEDGLLGSAHFTDSPQCRWRGRGQHQHGSGGRNWRGLGIAVGLEQSDLGATLGRVVQAHPEPAHDPHRRPLARGADFLPLGPLQLCPEGRAHSLLHQRYPRRLSSAQ